MPTLQPRDFESRLHEERSRYLVAELLCAVLRKQRKQKHAKTPKSNECNFGRFRFIAKKNILPCVALFATILPISKGLAVAIGHQTFGNKNLRLSLTSSRHPKGC